MQCVICNVSIFCTQIEKKKQPEVRSFWESLYHSPFQELCNSLFRKGNGFSSSHYTTSLSYLDLLQAKNDSRVTFTCTQLLCKINWTI